ncbi:hypothetical protein K438DRAFT_1982285 [Mycena galopus ATCC 62051]|nr:hypothetical protein K438DRAFT_1982285 [Mycena galopus ATCC 62051]
MQCTVLLVFVVSCLALVTSAAPVPDALAKSNARIPRVPAPAPCTLDTCI